MSRFSFGSLHLPVLVGLGSVLMSCSSVSTVQDWAFKEVPLLSNAAPVRDMAVNGKLIFPMGFYHVSWADGGTAQQRLDDLKVMSQAGFNFMMTEPIHDTEQEFVPLLQAAERQHMYVMADGIPHNLVQKLAQQPALAGFTVADDSNFNTTPQAVTALHKQVKALAPGKLTGISLAVTNKNSESDFFKAPDVVSNISYPIGNGGDEIGTVYRVMHQTVETARKNGAVPVAALQTFAWPKHPLPTPEELRNMTYQALMAGVRGVVYYAYHSGQNRLEKHPALWNEAKALAAQVGTLTPSLLVNQRTELRPENNNPNVLAVLLRSNSGSYLFVLNTAYAAQPMTLRVPWAKELRPVFSDASLAASLKFQRQGWLGGGNLSGQVSALGVQVFAVN